MDRQEDKKKMEKELIDNFLESFYQKLGYYPVVITNDNQVQTKDSSNIMSLKDLASYFEPFLVEVDGEKLPLNSKNRKRNVVELRFIFCHMARTMRYSLNNIGDFLDRDHSTIMYGLECFDALMHTDSDFKKKFIKISNHIKKNNESQALEYIDKVEYKPEPSLLAGLL